MTRKPVVTPPLDATLLTVAETAAVLRLSVSAIRAWILQRRIPYIKLGKAVRIRRADVDALIQRSVVTKEAA
jgi:excisionase family DNA binding protein